MADLKRTFKAAKAIDWSQALVTFYVLQRRLVNRKAKYTIFQVKANKKLRGKLRSIASKKMDNANDVQKYDFTTADLDGNLLGLPVKETELQGILEKLQAKDKPPVAVEYQELLNSWLYITRLDLNGHPPMFSARRVSDSWSTKKVVQEVNMIFRNNMLVSLDDKEIFRIDGAIDFLAFDGQIFIANKTNFESAMNFREGMLRNRDAMVNNFEKLGLFEDAHVLSNLIGDHMPRLRRLSQVRKAGYYKDKNYMSSLRKVCIEMKWEVPFTHEGKIVANAENIDVVLKVLNNDRLTSLINSENFDVDVKHKL